MAQARTLALGCTGAAVYLDILRQEVQELLVVQDESVVERTCVQLGSRSEPLCQADVLAAVGRVDLLGLYERLATIVELRIRRRLSPSPNRLVRDLLDIASLALRGCTALMSAMDDTGFREGNLDLDRDMRKAVDSLSSLLDEVASIYGATPLLLMAVLVEGGFSGVVAAMLQGRDIAELSRRGSLFHQVLLLIRNASRLPDVAQLLAAPTRRQGQHVSVLGLISALATSARVLLGWVDDQLSGRPTAASQQHHYRTTDLAGAAEQQDRQRKMASKLLEAHAALQTAVDSAVSSSQTAAALPPPPEADRLARMLQELQVAQGTPTAAAATPAAAVGAGSYYGASAGRLLPAGAASTSGLGAGGDGGSGSHHASMSYDGRYGPPQHHYQRSASAVGDLYGNSGGGGGGAYGNVPASAAPAYTLYQNGGSGAGPPVVEELYGITTGGLGTAVATGGVGSGQAARYSVESLRLQRELQRLEQAAAAAGVGTVAGQYARDGMSHQSQAEGLTAPFDPMVAASTLSYPWYTQQAAESAAAAAAAAAQETLHARQQQQMQTQQMQMQQQTQQQTQQMQTQQDPSYGYSGYSSVYEAVPVAAAPGGAAQRQPPHPQYPQQQQQQRGHSVPATPHRPSTTAAAASAAAAAPAGPYVHPQQEQGRDQQQQLQQLMLMSEFLSARLQHLQSGGSGTATTATAPAATVAAATAAAATSYDTQTHGRYLGGYSIMDTAGAPSVATPGRGGAQAAAATAADIRARSAARQRMPSADAAFSSTFSSIGGGVTGGSSILGTNGGGSGYGAQAARPQAWAEPAPWQAPRQTSQQQLLQPQQPPVRAVSSAGGPSAREPWLSNEAAAAEAAAVTAAAMGGSATVARPGSAARVRPLAMEDVVTSAAPTVWSPSGAGGGGGRVGAAWSTMPAEAAGAQQQQQQGRSTVSSGASRPASTSRAARHGSRPDARGTFSRNPGASRSSSSSSSGSSGIEPRGSRGATTMRALAADSGLIPDLSRSPREQQHASRQQQYQDPPPSGRPQSAPRTAPHQASAPAQPTGGLLDRHRGGERRTTATDPRVGAAPATRGNSAGAAAVATPSRGGGAAAGPPASFSPSALLHRYGAAYVPSQSARPSFDPPAVTAAGGNASYYHASAGSGSPRYATVGTNTSTGSSSNSRAAAARPTADMAATYGAAGDVAAPAASVRQQRSALDANTAAAGAVSAAWDLSRGNSVSGGGHGSSGGGAAVAAQRHSSPYRGAVDGPAAPAAVAAFTPQAARQPAAQAAPRQPSASVPAGVPSSARGTAAAAAGRSSRADDLRSAAAAGAAGALAAAGALSRRRMAASRQSNSSSDGGEYDENDDMALQLALQMSRQEAEATAAAEAVRASTAAAAAAANAAAAAVGGPPGSPPAGARAPQGTLTSSGAGERRAPSPSAQRGTVARLPSGAIDEGGGGGALVGAPVPIAALHQRYALVNPLLSAKLVSLEDDFPRTRRVAGDGNCFYRAALFALLEHVMAAPDGVLCQQLEARVEACVRRLERLQPHQLLQDTPQESAAAGGRTGSRSRAATPERPRADDSGRGAGGRAGSSSGGGGAPASPAAGGGGGGDPAAIRGGRRLLRLLRTAWFKAADGAAVEPSSDVSALERLFNASAPSGEVIRFARRLTVEELAEHEAFYAPFIPGCGGDYGGLSLAQICTRHVLPLGVEVEQLQIIALCRALGATVAVLDVAGSQVGAIKHGPAGHSGPPVAWVAHLPGHYDVVYPARRLDVAPGGMLVPADAE